MNSYKYVVGAIFDSNNYGKFEIIKKYNIKKFRIRFLLTGYEKDIGYGSMKQGEVRDPYYPIYYGIAYIGEINTVSYKKELSVWRAMLSRCYNSDDHNYYSYGEKGVTVCKEWLCFANFVNDFKKIKGYDEDRFLKGELELDKDLFYQGEGNKIYSLQTCSLIEHRKNFDEMLARRKLTTSSRYVGVTKLYDGKWQVTVVYNGKSIYGGRYSTEKEAYESYKKLKKDVFNNPEKYNLIKEKAKSKNKKGNKKYVGVYKNNKLILVYKGIINFSNKSEELLGVYIDRTSIYKVCNGKRKQCKGFTFKYLTKDEYDAAMLVMERCQCEIID